MESIESLEALLQALGRERDLRGRLRVLARAWKLLRSLPAAQREQVALRVGSRWAWRRIEKAFLRDGELDEGERLVEAAFERMGQSDPQEIRALARQLRAGDGKGARDLLLMTLGEALEDEAGAQEARPPEKPEPGPSAQEARPPEKPEPGPSAQEAEIVVSPGAVWTSARAQRVEEAPAETRPPATPSPPAALPTPAPTASPIVTPPPPAPVEIAPPAPPVPDLRASASLAPHPGPAQVYDGAARLRTLRELARSERPAGELGREGRVRLLDALGGGWASRRALSRMVAARSLDDLDEALSHVGRLLRPGQRSWILADLLAHWPLDDAEVERVLAHAPSDAARRRLARRAGRSGSTPARSL